MTEPTFDVHVVREFNAPVQRVWQAWTTPDDLQAWWGPDGFTCPRAEADVRTGGSIFVAMQAPAEWGGGRQHSRWDITDAAPPNRLAYVFCFADEDGRALTPLEAGIPADGVPDRGEHEVVLTAVGNDRTRLEMTEHGYTREDARDMSQAGLEQCLDKMALLVEGSAT